MTDDADSFKTVADELGSEHQVCWSHVQPNTETLTENLKPPVDADQDGSSAALGLTPEQARHDFQPLGELTLSRQPEQEQELAEIYRRYTYAASPALSEKAGHAYRLLLLFLGRCNLRPRLKRYRTWRGPHGETVDGTNNTSERAIGWWVKERYRKMRGFRRPESAVNVSRLLAWCGNHLDRGGADLATLIA